MKMIIDGKKVDSFDGSTIPVVNPATHKVIDSIPNATEKDVRKAIDVAKKGKKIWRHIHQANAQKYCLELPNS